ncbi:glycosyltransferase 87 family protein [Kribbella sp. NPDC051718]|uniref:glycosyltransferase 87 family protein n=1 Tax=Kribbella sp. NPDC051718 TaxID=3155168 RepID=UPI00344025AB
MATPRGDLRPAAVDLRPVVVGCALVLAGLLRLVLLDYQSWDYQRYLEPWAGFIDGHGGFAALKHSFSNYNATYLYLMAFASYLPLSPLATVKFVSLVFEVMLGWYVYRLVGLCRLNQWPPIAAGLTAVLLPTVILNGSMWGQADASYAALTVGALYYLIARRPWVACVLFGLALALKLQAIFLFPALLLFVLRRWLPWQALTAIPLVYLLLDVPALLLGASPRRLLLIYLEQADTDHALSINAPTIYNFLSAAPGTTAKLAGVLATGVILLGAIAYLAARRIEPTPTRIVLISALCTLLVPFLLPSMHERYFYLAEVLTVVAAFALPRPPLIAVPVLVQAASLTCYLNYLLKPYRLAEQTGKPVAPKYRPGLDTAHYLMHWPRVGLAALSTVVAVALLLMLYAVIRQLGVTRMPEDVHLVQAG